MTQAKGAATHPGMININVKPTSIIKTQVIPLPPLDQFMLRFYSPILLCFRLNPQADPHKIFWQLRCGLSDALDEYQFLAGRLVISDVERNLVAIHLSSDDGVRFTFNDLTSSEHGQPLPTFDELEQDGFPPQKFDPSLLNLPEFFTTKESSPCLLLQANFIQGGLLLGFCPHHSTSDSVAWFGFLQSWAKHTAAAVEGTRTPPLRRDDIFDRSSLFQHLNDKPLKDHHELISVHNPRESAAMFAAIFNSVLEEGASSKAINAYWYISASDLRTLKAAYSPLDAQASPWISTNNALCAFFWRHNSLARQLSAADNASSTCWVPCNIRSKLEPPLPADYVGNAMWQSHCSYPLSELYSSAPDARYRTAYAIRCANQQFDNHRIRSLHGAIDALPTINSAKYAAKIPSGPDFFATTLAEWKWYGLDWGYQLGKLQRIRLAFYAVGIGFNIFPKDSYGGIEVFACLERDEFERMQADDEFTRFAKLRCA